MNDLICFPQFFPWAGLGPGLGGGQREGFPSLLTFRSTSNSVPVWQQCTKAGTTHCADLSGSQIGIRYILVLLAEDLWEGMGREVHIHGRCQF